MKYSKMLGNIFKCMMSEVWTSTSPGNQLNESYWFWKSRPVSKLFNPTVNCGIPATFINYNKCKVDKWWLRGTE